MHFVDVVGAIAHKINDSRHPDASFAYNLNDLSLFFVSKLA